MPQVEIPDVVFQQIEQLRPESQSAADFVLHAIQDRLAWEDRKREFYRLSNETAPLALKARHFGSRSAGGF